MSKSPFVVTLVLCGTLLAWLYGSQEGEGNDRRKPGGTRALSPKYGYPDPRGIRLEIYERESQSCEASRFRAQSPQFILWDDGTLVYRDSTYDYRRGRIPGGVGDSWVRTASEVMFRKEPPGCDRPQGLWEEAQMTRLVYRKGETAAQFEVRDLDSRVGGHAATCEGCHELQPLARMLGEMHRRCAQGGDPILAGMPMEVYLQFRSCGCRNHPDIVQVSHEWPLAGAKPAELCGRGAARMRLEGQEDIRAIERALERSAAVLDRGEIYSCFMRPLLDPKPVGPLACR